ncbi:dormancy-associated protein 2 [Drosophila obscura]|uniref:dormancy-associated protein 2 n=1 Tax=Drosophila obscura TaxID=7282 RepID=UPI001BB163D0|nr:dormancy-associated protein 2 [Drosophila obscura]
MENGNYNGPEFGWEYSHGGQGQGGMSNYSQMNQGGRQWLHSNQNHNFNQQGMSQGQGQGQFASPPDPFADFNSSMMSKYGNYHPSGGKSDMYGSMVHGGGQEMGQDMSNGMGGMGGGGASVSPRMYGGGGGGFNGGSHNGLGDPAGGRGQNNGTSWF